MLKFSDVEPQIRTGDILLFQGRRWWSRLIRLRTLSPYSHVGVAYRMPTNGHTRLCVFEALEPRGVQLVPLDHYVRRGERIDWYELTDPRVEREKVADFLQRNWMSPYAMRSLFFVFLWWPLLCLGVLTRWFFRLEMEDKQKERFFCSKLAASALVYAGFRLDDGAEDYQQSPEAVSRFTCLQRKGWLVP